MGVYEAHFTSSCRLNSCPKMISGYSSDDFEFEANSDVDAQEDNSDFDFINDYNYDPKLDSSSNTTLDSKILRKKLSIIISHSPEKESQFHSHSPAKESQIHPHSPENESQIHPNSPGKETQIHPHSPEKESQIQPHSPTDSAYVSAQRNSKTALRILTPEPFEPMKEIPENDRPFSWPARASSRNSSLFAHRDLAVFSTTIAKKNRHGRFQKR